MSDAIVVLGLIVAVMFGGCFGWAFYYERRVLAAVFLAAGLGTIAAMVALLP